MTPYQRKFYQRGYAAALKVREAPYKHAESGRPVSARKIKFAAKYKLTNHQCKSLTQPFMDQLDRCKDDDARRVLLAVVCGRAV